MKTSANQSLIGLLYDLDLLPEQLEEKTREWAIMKIIEQMHNALYPHRPGKEAPIISPRQRELMELYKIEWKAYCDSAGAWYEDMPDYKIGFIEALEWRDRDEMED
jgi:hypothetical protein